MPSSPYSQRHKVLGYPVDVVNETEALEAIERAWSQGRGMHVVTVNAEMVIQAQKSSDLDRIVRHAHLIVPDGAGVVWALRFDGVNSVRVPGIELAHAALTSASRKNIPVALIGSRQEVLDKLREVLPAQHPGIQIVAMRNGFFGTDEEEDVINELVRDQPRLILVAMGVPRQEFFIDKWQSHFAGAVVIGVGGSFDVWAGAVKRAPVAFRKLHLEWFYRLAKEPWRAKRILSALPSFALQVLAKKLKGDECNSESDAKLLSPPRKGNKWHKPKRKSFKEDKSRGHSKDV